ncbi:MAG: hypothetical protein FXF54_11685 [Kosmotoga sp.]|nr:MAG: hypothetical protein FXF54_11685 [Kosmotoga sp.]
MKRSFVIIFVFLMGLSAFATDLFDNSNDWYSFSLSYEKGFVKLLNHTIQFGEDGNMIDYVTEGCQDILFPIDTYKVGITLGERHNIALLYQPLEINTKFILEEDKKIDYVEFLKGESLLAKYSFPFWRVSYTYGIINSDNFLLSIGASLQLRNASISFETIDGSKFVSNQNLGPVPVIKLYTKYIFNNGIYLEADVDGFYATSKWFNGADYSFTGSILDANLNLGFIVSNSIDTYINFRYLGGTAEGTSQDLETSLSDGYTSNNLSTFILSFGLNVH